LATDFSAASLAYLSRPHKADAGCRMPDAGCRAIPAAVSRDRMFSMNAGEKPAHI